MKSKKKYNTNKRSISVRRRMLTYYNRIALMLKLVIFVIIFAACFTNILDGVKKNIYIYSCSLLAKCGFVLKEIVIEGQKNADLKELIKALQADKGTPIFVINISDVKNRLEENPWIKVASVERKLPSTIYIAIIERVPVAIWQVQQKLYLIDSEGVCIAAYTNQEFDELPHVIGQEANIYAQNLIDDLGKYPNLAKRIKSVVRYGSRRWNLNFDNKMTVKMPETDFIVAYNYLNSLDQNDLLFNQNYKILDLRDKDKYFLEKY